MNKAREEKERIRKMTERGVPKATRPTTVTALSATGTQPEVAVQSNGSARSFLHRPVPNPVR